MEDLVRADVCSPQKWGWLRWVDVCFRSFQTKEVGGSGVASVWRSGPRTRREVGLV